MFFNPVSEAEIAEIERLAALGDHLSAGTTGMKHSFSDAELDPGMYEARNIVTASYDEAQLTGQDVQRADLIDAEMVRAAAGNELPDAARGHPVARPAHEQGVRLHPPAVALHQVAQ
jgi:hypothetical protein